MNDYLIKTPDGTCITLSASDSDCACLEANAYAQRHNILSCRASLFLDNAGGTAALGTFDLEGHQLPTTWRAFQALMSDIRDLAQCESMTNWDYACHYSRGVVLTAEDDQGTALLTAGDVFELPTSLTAFKAALALLQAQYPTVTKVYAEAGYNGANSLHAYQQGDYQPLTGTWSALVWVKGMAGVGN